MHHVMDSLSIWVYWQIFLFVKEFTIHIQEQPEIKHVVWTMSLISAIEQQSAQKHWPECICYSSNNPVNHPFV